MQAPALPESPAPRLTYSQYDFQVVDAMRPAQAKRNHCPSLTSVFNCARRSRVLAKPQFITKPKAQTDPTRKKSSPHRLWTAPEDALLCLTIDVIVDAPPVLGSLWRAVSEKIEGKTAKQCRERWLNHLSPALANERFDETEMAELRSLYATLGSHWACIAGYLNCWRAKNGRIGIRSDGSCKNRMYNKRTRKAHTANTVPSSTADSYVFTEHERQTFGIIHTERGLQLELSDIDELDDLMLLSSDIPPLDPLLADESLTAPAPVECHTNSTFNLRILTAGGKPAAPTNTCVFKRKLFEPWALARRSISIRIA